MKAAIRRRAAMTSPAARWPVRGDWGGASPRGTERLAALINKAGLDFHGRILSGLEVCCVHRLETGREWSWKLATTTASLGGAML